MSIPAAKKAKIGEAGFDEKSELDQVNVLYSFLEDRYMKQVCNALVPPSLVTFFSLPPSPVIRESYVAEIYLLPPRKIVSPLPPNVKAGLETGVLRQPDQRARGGAEAVVVAAEAESVEGGFAVSVRWEGRTNGWMDGWVRLVVCVCTGNGSCMVALLFWGWRGGWLDEQMCSFRVSLA